MIPFFSIIIPTYNRAHILLRAIDSVMNQSFQDFEIIVVDDGSTDNTNDLIKSSYASDIIYKYQTNSGVCIARNHGAIQAKGKYLVFLDSDDWLTTNCLERYHTCSIDSSCKLVLGSITYYDNNLNIIRKIDPTFKSSHYGQGLAGSFAISTEIFNRMGGYDIKLTFAENSDFFLRLRLESRVLVHQIQVAPHAGVCIFKEESSTRKRRYMLKKYDSVKYFLVKHSKFFRDSKRDFINFQRVLALSALRCNLNKEARQALISIIVRYPESFRTYFQLVLFAFPAFALKYYDSK